MLETLLQDARQALSHFRRSPWFAAAALFALALGIGANTAMFTILNALVLRQLPIKDPAGLIGVSSRNAHDQLRPTPIPAVAELTRDNGPLQYVCAYHGGVVIAVEANGTPTQAVGALVTGQCFTTFGITPMLGRPILDDDAPLSSSGKPVAVISHRFWTRMFGGDARVVGKTIRTEGTELTVVGVAPAGFGGLHSDAGVDVFAPFDSIFPARTDQRPGTSYILGRLRPRSSLEQARAVLSARWPALLEAVIPATLPASERGDLLTYRPKVEGMGTGLSFYRERYARPLTIVIGLTVVLLFVACVNLGGLLLARLVARGPELGVRLALGASRLRIAQQMLVESLLLSLSGAALAIPTSFGIVAVLASFIPIGIVERTITFTPDLRVLITTALVGLSVGCLIGALPISMAVRHQASARFTWDRTITGATSRWTRVLLVAQVALSVVMLIGAGLLTRSLYLLQQVDLGVRREAVLIARVMPLPNAYQDLDNASYYPALLERLAGLPGVRSVGFARLFPRLVAETAGQPIGFVGAAPGNARAVLEAASPGFFETVGIPLLSGRLPRWSDNANSLQVAVVSESLTRAVSPDQSIIGRRVRFGSDRAHQDVVVVGVVGNATLGNPRRPDLPVFYRPALQAGRFANYPSLAIATETDPLSVATGVRQALKEAGREYAHEISSLADLLAQAPASERMTATVATAVALLAVVLALFGVYGLLAYSVARRLREIGVRVAVGATPAAVVRMVVQEGFVLMVAGVAIGLACGFVAARALRTLMFGVSETDPLTFVAAAAVFLALGLAATAVPACRAARVDPMVALRAE